MDTLLAASPFVPFGLSHRVVLGVLAVGVGAAVVLGRRQRGSAAGRRTSRVFALVFAALLVPLELYWMLPGHWVLGFSLPLQLCDLAAVASVWALWSHSPTAFALTYYWGLTLTSQAFITPELNGPDFPSLQFVMFFALHSLVVWAAVYLVWGAGLRPNWRSYRVAVFATIVWGVAMFTFNRMAGTNYGFLNAKPLAGSMLDVLGPWPWYLLSELILGAAVWALITVPWVRLQTTPPAPAGMRHDAAGVSRRPAKG